jgi:methionine synthase I (cobalamin-dependent)
MAVRAEDYAGKVTISDGAWGTELDKLGCPPGFCREDWNLTKPELVGQVATAYVNAGSQIILTNTFGANRFVLAKHGKAEQVAAYNKAGAAISKQAAGTKAKVFGSIGPCGKMLVSGEVKEDELLDAFKVQAQALAEGGCDALVVETMTDLKEAAIAVRAAKTTGLLVVGCMTYDSGKDHTRTMMGVTPEQAVKGLTEAGADIIGCNCGIGIDNYITVAGMFRAATKKPIWVKANAGMPEVVNGKAVYKMQPTVFAEKVKDLIKAGANFVGGCCGTSPAFIAATAKVLK